MACIVYDANAVRHHSSCTALLQAGSTLEALRLKAQGKTFCIKVEPQSLIPAGSKWNPFFFWRLQVEPHPIIAIALL